MYSCYRINLWILLRIIISADAPGSRPAITTGGMPVQKLDDANVDIPSEQMGGNAVARRVGVTRFLTLALWPNGPGDSQRRPAAPD